MLKAAYEKGLITLEEFERFTDHLLNGRMFLLPDHVTDQLGTPDRIRLAKLREEQERARWRIWAADRRKRRWTV